MTRLLQPIYNIERFLSSRRNDTCLFQDERLKVYKSRYGFIFVCNNILHCVLQIDKVYALVEHPTHSILHTLKNINMDDFYKQLHQEIGETVSSQTLKQLVDNARL